MASVPRKVAADRYIICPLCLFAGRVLGTDEFADSAVMVTHLARGLASGTDIESTAPNSLQFALDGRRTVRGQRIENVENNEK